MLTGDENIIDTQFVVFWKIQDAAKFLFKVRNPELTVKLPRNRRCVRLSASRSLNSPDHRSRKDHGRS